MASKGPRSKVDHDSRTKRQKALDAPREPRRPKTHWDHVLEEMVWLSKDFESERRWKLAQAKKVATRASRDVVDQATKGVKRVKEEEQKLRKTALNISKDVKKFWTKIEKLVLYKHQLELDEKRKKALDKQLEFLLGQTERYSSMLAENLVQSETLGKSSSMCATHGRHGVGSKQCNETHPKSSDSNTGSQTNGHASDEDYDLLSNDESEDDEHTLEEDEALISKEEREEELAALQNESNLPLEELLERYTHQEGEHVDSRSPTVVENGCLLEEPGLRSLKSNGILVANHYSDGENQKMTNTQPKLIYSEKNHILHECIDEQEDHDFELSAQEEKEAVDDETTLLEEEQLAKADFENTENEILLLQRDNEIPLELLAKYKKGCEFSESLSSSPSEDSSDSFESEHPEVKQPGDDTILVEQDAYASPEKEDIVGDGNSEENSKGEKIIADAAAAAMSAQPTGNTFSTTKVRTKFPFLLKYPLREYQHIGLDWLVTMYENRLNGILADEMGLGKTIMTISLLGHLACEKGIWGPHLIVVPTSVMLNWETEFLKWCPAFKILTYFGSAKERRIKRQGWMKPNSFHVCITTYRLVIQDAKVFKRKKWKYLILDEAHLIKNWKSQRWQTLLNFNSKRRILLTGTPLQNDLMELWSLMHFLMPHVFQSHQEFKDWFCNPISGMVEGQEKVNKGVVDRLHNVLRPFILRRLKRDVEKQLPVKHEHVIYCRLSRRQRNLYEDFIASSETQATLASANFFGMISVIMQLRKVCNHPDLFEGRPTVSSFDMRGIQLQLSSSVCTVLTPRPFSAVDLMNLGLVFTNLDFTMESWEEEEVHAISTPVLNMVDKEGCIHVVGNKKTTQPSIFQEIQKALSNERFKEAEQHAAAISWWNSLRCKKKPIYGSGFRELVTFKHSIHDIYLCRDTHLSYNYSSNLADVIVSPVERFRKMSEEIETFMFAIPAARAPPPVCWCSRSWSPVFFSQNHKDLYFQSFSHLLTPFYPAIIRRQVYFPDRRLIQFDCGKLQELSVLLRRLKSEGHRALIFTQMTKMLDILEFFINLYGYIYMRLDGSTPPEKRQTLMQQFNTNPKIFLFILSTRSGGVGINLVGADTVIFYDSDWNPAMDQQAQDRCHRIGQTREVHIYRLISESTIEENILKKANQKRALDDLVIQGGGYNTEFFKKLDPLDLFSGHRSLFQKRMTTDKSPEYCRDMAVSNVDLEEALKNAEDEADYMALKKVEEEEAVDNQEFTEEAIAKMDDDEPINEEELRHGIPAERSTKSELGIVVGDSHPVEEGSVIPHVEDDDVDMLADVKQMAAAAAASGQAMLSFENQLRPIDRYAIRFLELWDPLIDKAAVEYHTDDVKEPEWELGKIEKLKEEMEAEIDEDEEPLVYESWDAEFATEVYKQQVEILAQHQLKEDLEREAREKEALEFANMDSPWSDAFVTPRPKPKKKAKKAKFKSLKKEAFVSKSIMKDESSLEPMSLDDDLISDDLRASSCTPSSCSMQEKKRPASDDDEHEHQSSKKSKKSTTSAPGQMVIHPRHSSMNEDELKAPDDGVVCSGSKHMNRNKNPGNLSIPMLPPKSLFTIKQEKLKRKGVFYSKDFSSPDIWAPTEDALLCALVHEYGPNWSLAGDIMYGLTAGGSYRGRFHHPVNCSERFKDLCQRYIFSSCDATNDKPAGTSSSNASIRVNEENVRGMLAIASGFLDTEPLLQTHFSAILYSTWRALQKRGKFIFVKNGYYADQKFGSIPDNESAMVKFPERLEFTNLHQCGKLVAAALNAQDNRPLNPDGWSVISEQRESHMWTERMDLTLELQVERDDALLPLPSVVDVSILVPEPAVSSEMHAGDENNFKSISQLRNEHAVNAGTSLFVGEPQGVARVSRRQHSGKDKLQHSDSAKPSKLKSRSSNDHSEFDKAFHLTLAVPMNLLVEFDDLSSSVISEAGIFNFDANYLVNLDSENPPWPWVESPVPGMLPFEFSPDDLSTLPEFTDIG